MSRPAPVTALFAIPILLMLLSASTVLWSQTSLEAPAQSMYASDHTNSTDGESIMDLSFGQQVIVVCLLCILAAIILIAMYKTRPVR